MANPLEALAVVNQHIRRERDHSITGEGAVCNKRKACTSIADLTDDNLCQILNLLPIEDRIAATQCGVLRELAKRRDIYRSCCLRGLSRTGLPWSSAARRNLLAWTVSLRSDRPVHAQIHTLVVPEDCAELLVELAAPPRREASRPHEGRAAQQSGMQEVLLAVAVTWHLRNLRSLAVAAMDPSSSPKGWGLANRWLPKDLQVVRLGHLPVDDSNLKIISTAMKALTCLRDLSLQFSGRSAAAHRSLMPEGHPSVGAQMLIELLVECPLLQCLSITSLIQEDTNSGLLMGALPDLSWATQQLQLLQLHNCGVTGIGQLPPSCQQLDVTGSRCRRILLHKDFCQAPQLRVLRASGLSLERHLPNSLHAIELVGNGQWLSAMNLDRVSGCSQLQSLRLSGWDLRLSQFDMVAKALDELPQLRSLVISDSANLDGSQDPISLLPLNSGALGRLTALSLAGNGLVRMPPRLEMCTALRQLDLSRNRLLVESASIGGGGCDCDAAANQEALHESSKDPPTANMPRGVTGDIPMAAMPDSVNCNGCRAPSGMGVSGGSSAGKHRLQLVVMERHAQLVLAKLRALEVLDLSAQIPVSRVAEMSDNGGGEGGPAPGLDASCTANTTDTSEGFQKERKSAVREGAALWSAALQAGRPYLLDNEPFTLQKLALAQLLNHVATTRGIGSMALCALWHGGLTHARGSGVWQFMHPQGGTFVDSDACDLWAPPQLARALVRLRACTPAGRQPGSSAVAPSLCCGPLLVPGRHACFEGPWSEEPDPKRQKI